MFRVLRQGVCTEVCPALCKALTMSAVSRGRSVNPNKTSTKRLRSFRAFEGSKYAVSRHKRFDECGILHHSKGDIHDEKTNRAASGYDPVLQFGSVQHED